MNARSACLEALREWEEHSAFADQLLHQILERSHAASPDRALLTELFYGILRNLTRLDFTIDRLAERLVDKETRRLLRLGLYQIFDTRIPGHAAVNETVALAGRSRGFVNALLRRTLREMAKIELELDAAPLAVRYSHPQYLLDRWTAVFGEADTEALIAWNNLPAPVYATPNRLRVTAGELIRGMRGSELVGESVRVRQVPFMWIAAGLCYVQDPSTLSAPDLLGPQPGENVLDACAAPGGKTGYMAGLMRNSGSIAACDVSASRLLRTRENLKRLGVENTTFHQVDWEKPGETFRPASFDRILVDAPCTNTGVIRRRIDVRWRLRPEEFAAMAERQFNLTKNLVPLLKPGGRLVYSTCSLEHEENEEVVARLAAAFPELTLIEERRTLPFRDQVDGSYAALFEKRQG